MIIITIVMWIEGGQTGDPVKKYTLIGEPLSSTVAGVGFSTTTFSVEGGGI